MKKRWRVTAVIAAALVVALAVTGVVLAQGSRSADPAGSAAGQGTGLGPSQGAGQGVGQGQGRGPAQEEVTGREAGGWGTQSTTPSSIATQPPTAHVASDVPLSPEETEAVIYLREEEKLAHDVYAALYAEWGTNIFSNIAASETKHMESVMTLLEAYGIVDPVGANGPGVFSNTDLQTLYNELLAKGTSSLNDAFEVGVTIEETDLGDLRELLGVSTHADVTEVAQNLLRGSQNHLSAFTRQVDR